MKDFNAEKIRNIAVVGHGSCGKTTLAAAFLFDTGATTRLTQVDKGNTVTDYDADEIERQISINSSLCHLEWNGHKINLIDTPGALDFIGEPLAALAAVEMAEAVLTDSKRVLPCAAYLEGEFGVSGYFLGVPVVIGANGVEKILEFELTTEEKEALQLSVKAVAKQMEATGL